MKFYILPAFGDTGKEKPYKIIAKKAKSKGMKVEILNLQIKQGKVLSELRDIATKTIEDSSMVFGFSMGALIGYLASTKVKPEKIILASVSPYLANDVKTLGPRFERHIGKRLTADVMKLKYAKILAKKMIILFGENEHPVLRKRTAYLHKKTKGSKLIKVHNTGHELSASYLKAILDSI